MRFLYIARPVESPEFYGHHPLPGEPWLKVGKHSLELEAELHKFYMDWRSESSMPPADVTAEITRPYHIRAPYNTHSFGHTLRDNVEPMIRAAARLGKDPRRFTWLMWPTSDKHPRRWQEPMPVQEHYAEWWGGHVAMPQHWMIGNASAAFTSSTGVTPRYLVFREVMAGTGADEVVLTETAGRDVWSKLCSDASSWKLMRQMAYEAYNIQHVPTHRHTRPRVIVLANQREERRSITNIRQLVVDLSARFPNAEVRAVAMSALSPREQMRIVASSAIMISNMGSKSFRLVYMPDGAQVIMIGTRHNLVATAETSLEDMLYRANVLAEADMCWAHLGYVSVIPYRVQDYSALTLGTIPKKKAESNKYPEEQKLFLAERNADIRVDVEQMAGLLEVALAKVSEP